MGLIARSATQKGSVAMPILNKLSGAFPTALIYITLGTLIVIWTLVTWAFDPPDSRGGYYWVVGFLLTGLALLLIGLFLGQLGRVTQQAALPPQEVTAAAVQSETIAAARTPIIVPVPPIVSARDAAGVATTVAQPVIQ
jgi:hypothetical protein